MISAQAGMEGVAPTVEHGKGNPEALKYGRLWEMPQYRQYAPGEDLATLFLSQAKPRRSASVIDFGCGTGRGALMLSLIGGLRVTMVDFVGNCLDLDVRNIVQSQPDRLQFVKADLEVGVPLAAEYGFCTDVMEHIPPDKVDLVLNNILRSAQHVFFSIATQDDALGKLIGEPLHLTVRPYTWWLEEFKRRDCLVHWSQDQPGSCQFYVTAWLKGTAFTEAEFPINVEEETVREHVRINTGNGWNQVIPHPTNDMEVMILGGGPSLAEHLDEIQAQRERGVKLITLNGAYNWALENGLTPSAQVMVDARQFNARFTKPVIDGCRYLIASQCHPDVFIDLPKDRTFIWHSDTELNKDILDAAYPAWFSVPGGTTVLTRAIPLLRMLGFKQFHLYGCDSCLTDDAHHAYAQPENDGAPVIPVVVNAAGKMSRLADGMESGRMFYCNPWMITQAQELMNLIRFMGDEIELEIHGDGLLAHILRVGAAIESAG